MIRAGAAALAVLLLAGCAAALPQPSEQACDIRKAAEIPVTSEQGFIIAPATIDGRPVTLLIDTGAERSLVTPGAMGALRLDEDRRNRTTIHGTGGTITTQNARLQSFGIGGMDMMDQSLAVGPLPVPRGAADLHASGVLGADWLSDFDVEFDLRHRRIALYRVTGCSGDYVPWPGRKVSVLARLYGNGLVLLPVTLDGHPLTALLDSGANNSMLAAASAERAGASPADLAHDRTGQMMGVDGAGMTTHQHRFGQLAVADAHYPNPSILIGSLRLPMADMLLGADWLRGNRVWMSHASRRVTFQPGGA